MTDKVLYLTKEGLEKIQSELAHLVKVRRKEIAARIQEAKELGDLSENAEYQEAKNEQAFNEGRIEELDNIIKQAVIITEAGQSDGTVRVGCTVTVATGHKKLGLSIVGSNEADPLSGKISNESPLGQALLGRQAGETVTVATPKGQVEYTIETVS